MSGVITSDEYLVDSNNPALSAASIDMVSMNDLNPLHALMYQ